MARLTAMAWEEETPSYGGCKQPRLSARRRQGRAALRGVAVLDVTRVNIDRAKFYRVDCRTRGCHSVAEHAVDPHGSCSLRAKRRTAGTRSPAPRPHHRPPCSSPRRVSNEIPPVGMRAHSAQHTVFHTGTSTVLVVARQTGRMPAWWLLGLNSRAVPRCTSHRADTLLSRLPCCGRLARDLRP